jgi:flagellar basal body-associated protein FliL
MIRIGELKLTFLILIISILVAILAIFIYYQFISKETSSGGGTSGLNYSQNIEYINATLNNLLETQYVPPPLPG